MVDSKERFSNRVGDYVRYRPSYPREVIELAKRRANVGPGSVVADVGSGTGIFARLLLETGARVLGVEPNGAMRAAAEEALAADSRFESVPGSAEATTLPSGAVDVVSVAQAFHWFDPVAARAEFLRVLKPSGRVLLVWNLRKDTAFHRDYDELLGRYAVDYAKVRMRELASEPSVASFFSPDVPEVHLFEHAQLLDEPALRGRLLSASYAPLPGNPNYEPMLERLTAIFRAHAAPQSGGLVSFAYETRVYIGALRGRVTPRR